MFFDISPDGRFVAVQVSDDSGLGDKIHVLDTNRDVMTVLDTEPKGQRFPLFSPDRKWVYYLNGLGDENLMAIYRHRTDGSGQVELVHEAPNKESYLGVGSISVDGKDLYISQSGRSEEATGRGIFILHPEESGETATKEIWHAGPGSPWEPVVSPNGRWVAFNSHHEGVSRIYVKARVGEGGLYFVSSGLRPQWSPDGSTLYFCDLSKRSRLMAAEVKYGHEPASDEAPGRFEIGQIKIALELDEKFLTYRIAPDGKSVIIIHDAKPEGEDGDQRQEEDVDDLAVIQVVRNFFTELERVAPSD